MKEIKVARVAITLGTAATLLSMHVGLESLRDVIRDRSRKAYVQDVLRSGWDNDISLGSAKIVSTPGDPVATDFLRILRSPQAEATFVHLATSGPAGAHLYALCGLDTLQSRELARLISRASTDERWVFLDHGGCVPQLVMTKQALQSPLFWNMCKAIVDSGLSNPPVAPTVPRPPV